LAWFQGLAPLATSCRRYAAGICGNTAATRLQHRSHAPHRSARRDLFRQQWDGRFWHGTSPRSHSAQHGAAELLGDARLAFQLQLEPGNPMMSERFHPMAIQLHAAVTADGVLLSHVDTQDHAESLRGYFRDNGVAASIDALSVEGDYRVLLRGITAKAFDWLIAAADVELI
jgi:hypothetical protein